MIPKPASRIIPILCALVLFAMQQAQADPVAVFTHHNGNSRPGTYENETILRSDNITKTGFGKLFTLAVDGQVFSQPLYIPNLTLPDNSVHDVLFVATEHNSVFAFDADGTNTRRPLWRVNLGPSVPSSSFDTKKTPYRDIFPEIGILSTPVIDVGSNTLYVCAYTKVRGKYFYKLHALDVLTGHEKFNGPVTVSATVAGSGDGSKRKRLDFSAQQHLQRPALLLSNGMVYLAFGSHIGQTPYHGWIIGYDAQTLARGPVFNSSPNGGDGGIWQAGEGLSTDVNGNIYAAVGSGISFNGRDEWDMSLVKLQPNGPKLSVVDWFAPYNWLSLGRRDLDVGTTGVGSVPDADLVFVGSKSGLLYVLNASSLGHLAPKNRQIVQQIPVSKDLYQFFTTPVYWNQRLYVWPGESKLQAYPLQGTKFGSPVFGPRLTLKGLPGAILSISSSGTTPGTGVLWATLSIKGKAGHEHTDGMLVAYDASNVKHELWNSTAVKSRDNLGTFAKFTPPMIANGRVYVATLSKTVVVYGLMN